MSTRHAPHTPRITATAPDIGTNEKAILDRIRIPVLKSLATSIWRAKLHLQFTGWLQYTIPALFAIVVFLLYGLAQLLGGGPVATFLGIVGSMLLAVTLFDLVTVKFRQRPAESLPERKDDLGMFDLMRSRRSCRSFQTRKLTADDHNELLRSVQVHSNEPTIGQSPVRFEYISAPLTVWPTVNATEFLVALAPKKYDRLAIIDVGHRLQKIVMDATRMGLGTCWIGPGADHASIMHHLGNRFNPEVDQIICVCAVGYKSGYTPIFLRIFNAQLSRRLPLSSLFFADLQFQTPLDVGASPFNQFGRTFEICEWAPSSYNGQTTRCVAVTKEDERGGMQVERFDFYATTESRYYAAVATGIWCANWELGCKAMGLHGHFARLSAKERAIHLENGLPPLPRYDVSWILDENS